MQTPRFVKLDNSGGLYVADAQNNRVLYFATGSTTASRVYGQDGSFTTTTNNKGGVSATSLSAPFAVTLDNSGGLYVADYGNHRVLYFATGSTMASRVYGQGGSFTTGNDNKGGVSADSLVNPCDVTLDSSEGLYVADNTNNRVLYFATGSTRASRVYGQGGSFTTGTFNNGGVSANSLANPYGVVLDNSGGLYVADFSNNRVLYFATGNTTASRVYGQGGNFTNKLPSKNKGGVSATSLYWCTAVTLDSSGGLYVSDSFNHRVLYFATGSTTACRVYGQGGNFTSNTLNKGGVSADSLNYPRNVALDSSGGLYVADAQNNRVLYYV